MSDLMSKLESAGKQEGEVTLSELRKLAEQQIAAEGALARAEEVVKTRKKELNKLKLDLIPEAFQKAKIKDTTLEDGRKIILETKLTCSVPAKRKGEIMDDVESKDGGHLISREITIDLGKDDPSKDNMTGELRAKLEELGFQYVEERSINTTSLKAWIAKRAKEAGEKGEVFDLSFYGAYEVRQSKIS